MLSVLTVFAHGAENGTQEESNLLLLRVILFGREIAAAIDGEERGGIVYVNIAELAEALEESPSPPLMVAVSNLDDYFPAQFDADLRAQTLLIFGRGETAIERRLIGEYEAARYRPPPLEYPIVEAPPRRWLAIPFASFHHRVGRPANGGDALQNSISLFGDFLKGDGRLSAHDGGMSLNWRRGDGGIFASRDFGGRSRISGHTPQWNLIKDENSDNPISLQFDGRKSSDGAWQSGARLRGTNWNGGFSITRDGGDSVFGGFSLRPESDSPFAGMSLRFSGSRVFDARQGAQESVIAANLFFRQFSLSAERRRNRGRGGEDSLKISKRLRLERILLSLRSFADFDGGGRKTGGSISATRRFRAFDYPLQWRAELARDFSSPTAVHEETASFSLSGSRREKLASVEWRRDFRADKHEFRALWSHRPRGGKFTHIIQLTADNKDNWSAFFTLRYAIAWNSRERKFHLSHELENTGALSICARTSDGEPVPGMRFIDRKIKLNDETGCAFIPAAGAREIVVDKKSLPPRMNSDRIGARFRVRPGGVAAADFALIISGEVEGVLTTSGIPLGGIAIHLIKISGKNGEAEDARMNRTAYDGYYLFSDVAPGEYLLRVGQDKARRKITVGEDKIVRANFNL